MKLRNKTLLLVDGQNAAWRAYHAYSRLSYKGKGVGMIYGLPSMMAGLMNTFQGSEMIIVWEGRKSPVRKRTVPSYKEGRNSKALIDYDDFLEQKKNAMKALYLLGIKQSHNEMLEGDDLLYKLWRLSKLRGYEQVIIVSSDKDFNQLIGVDNTVGHTTKVFNEHKKEMITKFNCKDLFGYHPYQTIDYLTLVGDSSDNIPGYRGIGEKKAVQLLEKYDSLANFLDSGDSHPIIKRKSLLELIKIAQVMINLEYHYDKFIKNVPQYKTHWYANETNPKLNPNEFRKLAAVFNMRKLMGNSFLNKFQ